MTKLALVNNTTNKVENVTVDDRQASEITIEGYTVLDLDTTPTLVWTQDKDTLAWSQIEGDVGIGGIGDTWDGTRLIEQRTQEELNNV